MKKHESWPFPFYEPPLKDLEKVTWFNIFESIRCHSDIQHVTHEEVLLPEERVHKILEISLDGRLIFLQDDKIQWEKINGILKDIALECVPQASTYLVLYV